MNICFVTIACLGVALAPGAAFAVDLTVDQKQAILMPDKTPATACDEWSNDPKPVCQKKQLKTVGWVIQNVCMAQLMDPQTRGQDPGNAKSGALAIRLYGADNPVLTLDEIKLILARVDRIEDPVTIARMHDMLEPKGSAPTEPSK